MSPDHGHTESEERRIRDAALDETVEDSFPASDPPSTIPNPDNDEAASRPRADHAKTTRVPERDDA